MSSVRVAVDIGGTFTDIVVLDSEDGKTRVEKEVRVRTTTNV